MFEFSELNDLFKSATIKPSFKKVHVILSMFIFGENPQGIGRYRLKKELLIGSGTARSLITKLNEKIQEEGLSNRVFTKKCSLFNIDFPDETFDIIWAEGSIHIAGFEKGLKELRHLLRQDGYLVVHDGIKDVSNKLRKLPDLGYNLTNQFMLPEDSWWIHYFKPLEQLIKQQRKNANNNKSLSILERYQTEVNTYKMNPKENNSAFYILQKK